MNRRDFIELLGYWVVAWPVASHAQQRSALPFVGFLHGASPASQATHVAAFQDGLGQFGYVEGRNVMIEYRWAEGRFDRFPELAADLARRQVNVIAVPGHSGAALAVKAATATIPIVFGVPEDPVKLGLVASFAHPGGNATGVSYFNVEVVAKRLGLLHELVPTASRVAVLVNPANAAGAETTNIAVKAARAIGVQIEIFKASTSSEIEDAFAAFARRRPDALLVGPDAFFNNQRGQLANLAARHAIPASYSVRDYVDAGGLMSYGTSIADMFRQVGAYTGRILNGEKPADLPVVQPTKFELVINLKTARALGLTIPQPLLLRADEVIQ